MEKTADDFGPNSTWWHADFYEKLQSISLSSSEETLNSKEPINEHEPDVRLETRVSQNLWATGKIAEPLPNGFYAVLPERRLKELFEVIPSLEELHSLDSEGFGLDVVVVDFHKDKKLSMLKQLTLTLVKGLNSNPAALIKKIAGLVSDFYKRPNTEQSNMKCLAEEGNHASENQGIQMLGQIRQGSCHPRAILFKVLADTIGLDCRLVVGLPREGVMERTDSYKHMSVIVMLNSLELLVDLVRHPGKLIPCSAKAILLSHISTTSETESAEYDSCDSPLEPNSPITSDHVEVQGLSRTEPYIENSCWRQSRRKVFIEQRTASSSPDPPLFREHRRSILGSHRYSFKDDANEMTSSRSAGASPIQSRRRRRRCISMVPEIGDDIVSVVRAMNDTMKGKRIPTEQVEPLTSSSIGESYISSPRENVSNFGPPDDNDDSGKSAEGNLVRNQMTISQRAISLPSSPNRFRFPDLERTEFDILARTNTNHLLLPYEEWNIDFSELTVGSRVGIGFFGEVFRGVWNGTEVAIKVLLEQDLTVENIEDFCNEISILSRLRHPNVILFLGACTRPPRLSMITEFMEMGSLYYLIHVSGQKQKISWRRRLKMLCDICRGLMCIHRMKIAHRDLKSANCLVNKHLTVKICDFGLSRVLTDGPIRDSSSAGTPEWMAPELIRNEAFTEKCDIFSLGVIMWELCTLNRPWEGVPPINVVYAIAHDGLRLEIPEGPIGKIIADCWAEPDERPSCDEILSRLLHC